MLMRFETNLVFFEKNPQYSLKYFKWRSKINISKKIFLNSEHKKAP